MVHLSQAAIDEVNRMRGRHINRDARFRLGVQPGGCADYYYTLSLDDGLTPDDRVFNYGELQLVVDPQSWKYLDGLRLDYTEDLMGGGFRFHNPNAAKSCGCGNSFSLE